MTIVNMPDGTKAYAEFRGHLPSKRSVWWGRFMVRKVRPWFPPWPIGRVRFGLAKWLSTPHPFHYGGGWGHGVTYRWLWFSVSIGKTL
jgi:hypothetical protein